MLIFFSTSADTIFPRRPMPDPFTSHAWSDFNAIKTEKALGDSPPELPGARDFLPGF